MKRLITLTVGILFFFWANQIFSQEEKIGDIGDGSRSKLVHLIKLIDHDSSGVRLDNQPLMPFSTKQTCGPCHDYEKIRHGWHFSAGDSSVASGRPGHPWIYVDQQSSTQIPLSLRQWPGTFTPQQIGMTTLAFLQRFGRQMPGGGIGEDEDARSLDNLFRWMVSGDLEINCLSCHDAEFAYDQAEHAAQTLKENFRWTATASSAFAWVHGSARDMPLNYDIYMGTAPDIPEKVPPQVLYDNSRFNHKNEVFFDLTRKIPDENCYFCHSTKIISTEKTERWHYGGDVHLTSGLHCVDCHRNGLDHHMVRGYEDEDDEADHFSAALSCEGCHMGNEEDSVPYAGKSGAPRPEHPGIPPVHFENMTCTACHSGEWPAPAAKNIKTSAGHALGVHGVNKSDTGLPHIMSPVFIKQSDGKIAPHNLIWPAYWAQMTGDTITPLAMDIVQPVTQALIVNDDTLHTGNWLDLKPEDIVKIIDSLQIATGTKTDLVYISGGYLHRIVEDSLLQKEEHPTAAPYAWPIGHDVRPASQSLGIRSCNDCHSTDSPLYYGRINIDSPLNQQAGLVKQMIEFQDINRVSTWIFSFSFLFRPWLKLIIIISVLIIASVLLLYSFKGLSIITSAVGSKK